MLKGVFVTGTDTNVGKTVAAACILARFEALPGLRYWKPVQTGIDTDDDTAEVRRLSGCSEERIFAEGIRLRHAVSPHLAARLNGTTLDPGALAARARTEPETVRWVVEGAGGVLVPLTDRHLMIDFIEMLALPTVVVARTALGTINHTLLTLGALRARSFRVCGVVMAGDRNAENRLAIERYGDVPVIAEIPCFEPLAADGLRRWAASEFDRDARLLEALG
jgi:dethiobiotin synthase